MPVSIKKRIYWSFTALVALFVINGIASLITLHNNRNLSDFDALVTVPSIHNLEDLRNLALSSKMYTVNCVLLPLYQQEMGQLKNNQTTGYTDLKSKISKLAVNWIDTNMVDSLKKGYKDIEQLFAIENRIVISSSTQQAEKLILTEAFPRSETVEKTLSGIIQYHRKLRYQKASSLEASLRQLKILITILSITIIALGIFLSIYMTRIIIRPLKLIRNILNDLGNGVIKKIKYDTIGNDEIGDMVRSVNNLSDKLHATATFAEEVGNRNFDSSFEPLSDDDALGKSLIAMRNNIKSSDEKLNYAQHVAQLGSWERNIAEDKMYLSDELYNIFDIDPKTMGGGFKRLLNLVHPDDLEYYRSVTSQNIYNDQHVTFEIRIISEKGITKNVFVQTDVEVNASGKIIRAFGIVQDITERKKVEEQIRLSNERYELVTKTTHDMIWDFDLVNNTIFRNENYNTVFGHEGGDRNDVGKWIKQVHPDDRDWVSEYIQKKIEDPTAESWEVEFRYFRYNDEMAYLYDRGYIIRDSTNKAVRMVGATCDITERKKAETAFHKSEERYRRIVETAQEGIWLTDENNFTTFVNKKMCELLEYSQEELIDKQNNFFTTHLDGQQITDLAEAAKQGLCETHDCRFTTKTGKLVWTSISTNPVFDDKGIYQGALAMITDITRRKQDEELLKKSKATLSINNRELEQKNKELEQFAYVASHDLQEPLRTTISFVEIFKKQYFGKLDPMADKYLGYIVQSSQRMSLLIKDLLEFSRIGINKDLELVDCNMVLSDVLIDITKKIKDANAEIIAGPLPIVSGYRSELKQLFQNLVINAIKFRRPGEIPKVEIASTLLNGHWQFSFTDNGIGIDKAYYERIFIIFQRLHTRSQFDGSGIGLSHCKKIVELHHGKIWVESVVGEGSVFYFTIPEAIS
ncbi:MAG: PAS domain S-box protein [Ferruginibacter sp.]